MQLLRRKRAYVSRTYNIRSTLMLKGPLEENSFDSVGRTTRHNVISLVRLYSKLLSSETYGPVFDPYISPRKNFSLNIFLFLLKWQQRLIPALTERKRFFKNILITFFWALLPPVLGQWKLCMLGKMRWKQISILGCLAAIHFVLGK